MGVVPLALKFGFPVVQQFLAGANAMDTHFQTQDLTKAHILLSRPVVSSRFIVDALRYVWATRICICMRICPRNQLIVDGCAQNLPVLLGLIGIWNSSFLG